MSIKNDIEAAADQMGLDAADFSQQLASDISSLHSHKGNNKHGGGYAAATMMRDELDLDAPLVDVLAGIVAFIGDHTDIDEWMTREAQAQIAQDLGDDTGLTFNEYTAEKTRPTHPDLTGEDDGDSEPEKAIEVEAQDIRAGDVLLDDGVLMEPTATADASYRVDGSAVVSVEGREIRFKSATQKTKVCR